MDSIHHQQIAHDEGIAGRIQERKGSETTGSKIKIIGSKWLIIK